jgi:hypothetical protein
VTTESLTIEAHKPAPAVCQVAVNWVNKVVFAPDTVHGGVPTPGLAGRLYLFGPEVSFPLVGDGSVVVDLYDDTPVASGGQARLLEKWVLNAQTLGRLQRRDMIGEGYTLFLPWGSYRPDITQVHLMVCYTPARGNPLYAPSSSITLNGGNQPPNQVTNRTVVPAAAPQVAAPSGPYAPPQPGVAAPRFPAPSGPYAPPPATPQATFSPPAAAPPPGYTPPAAVANVPLVNPAPQPTYPAATPGVAQQPVPSGPAMGSGVFPTSQPGYPSAGGPPNVAAPSGPYAPPQGGAALQSYAPPQTQAAPGGYFQRAAWQQR